MDVTVIGKGEDEVKRIESAGLRSGDSQPDTFMRG